MTGLVLITGAFGQLGEFVIAELLRQGYAVRAFDLPTKANRRTARRYGSDVQVAWGDIRDERAVRAAVSDVMAVIHNAAILAPFSEIHPDLARAVNVDGTRNLIKALQTSAQPPQLILASSVSVTGLRGPDDPPVRGTDFPVASDHYTAHKAECEKLLKSSSLPWTILRIGVSAAPRVPQMNGELLGVLFRIDPNSQLEYVHPEDVARAQVNALGTPQAIGKVFMVGGGASCRTRFGDFNQRILELSGVGELPWSAFGSDRYYTAWMDTDESQALLRYQSRSLQDFYDDFGKALRTIRWLTRPVAPLVRTFLRLYGGRRAATAPRATLADY